MVQPSRKRPGRATAPVRDPAVVLREAGLVFTLQRRAIWTALVGREDHPTADSVYDALGPDAGISVTTVYRTLEAFVGAGLAQRVGHTGTAVRYDPRTEPHHHLVCESCGAVRDLEESALGSPALPSPGAKKLNGFEVRDVSVIVRGRCAACAAR